MAYVNYDWKPALLAALRRVPVISHGCETAGVSRSAVLKARKADKAFDEAVLEALEEGVDNAEREAFRRGVHGFEEPVLHQGQPTYLLEYDEAGYPVFDTVQEEHPETNEKGEQVTRLVDVKRPRRKLDEQGRPIMLTVRKHSDSLLTLVLKGRRKEVFADRTELTGPKGGPVQGALIVTTGVPAPEDDEPIA